MNERSDLVLIEILLTENLALKTSEQRHLLLSVKPILWLFTGIDNAHPQLFQFLVDLSSVVAELFKDILQCLGERGLKVRVVVQFNIKIVANCVFNFCCLCFGAVAFSCIF